MRVVVKPAGLLILLLSLGVLAFLAFGKFDTKKTQSLSPPVRRSNDLVSPVAFSVSGELGAKLVKLTPVDLPTGAKEGVRVTLTRKLKQRWDVQLIRNLRVAVPAGQSLTFSFKARSKTRNKICAVYEQAAAPYPKSLEKDIILTPEWTDYTFTFTTPAYAAAGAGYRLQIAYDKGEFEFADPILKAN
jgi:hypothetical protein